MPTPTVEQPQHRIAHQTGLRVNPQRTRRDQTHQVAQRHSPPVYPQAAPSYALWLFPAIVIGGLVLLAAILAGFQKRRPAAATPPRYTAAPSMLTATERRFWQSLRLVTGDRAHVLMKVRLADVLLHERGDRRGFAKVSQKHVDFLLCHPETLRPLLAVELDDRSHTQQRRKERDAFVDAAYASAALPVLHIPVDDGYSLDHLRAQIDPHLSRAIMP